MPEKYRDVVTKTGILVNVPKSTDINLTHIPAYQENGVKIDSHYRAGLVVGHNPITKERRATGKKNGKPIICTRNFFKITEDNLGKQIVADVTIQEKTVDGGRKFTLLKITRVNRAPTHELKLMDESQSGNDVHILNSSKLFHFKPIAA